MRRPRLLLVVGALALIGTTIPSSAAPGFKTKVPPMLSLGPDAPAGSNVKAIISSGDMLGTFEFEGIPDGIGLIDNGTSVDVFVTHEQSRVPFPVAVAPNPPITNGVAGLRDFVDSSISKLTINNGGKVVAASVALSPAEGFIRFCSAFMAGPAEGFDDYVFFANEESDDDLAVPAGATYGPDPSLGTLREAGYAVYLDVETGEFARSRVWADTTTRTP